VLERDFAKLQARNTLSADEQAAIRGAIEEVCDQPADHVLITPWYMNKIWHIAL
jgi:hypothetical protein